MNKKILLNIIVITAAFGLAACAQIKTANIFKKEESGVAITINKDLSTSIVAIKEGELIEPCKVDLKAKDRDAALRKCYPEGHNPDGDTLARGTWEVQEGSICIRLASGSHIYVFCQPPYDLGL